MSILTLVQGRITRAFKPISGYRQHVLIDICTGCNNSCFYCLHQRNRLVKKEIMSMDVYEKVIDILARENTKLVYLYQSGEPFVNTNIYDFVSLALSRNIDVSIATRLSIPVDWDKMDKVLEYSDKHGHYVELLVTIDSLKEDVIKQISPGINVKLVSDNLDKLQELQSKHHSLKCVFSTIVSKHNESGIRQLEQYLKSREFTNWTPESFGYFLLRLASKNDIELMLNMVPQDNKYRKRWKYIDGKMITPKKCPDHIYPVIDASGNVLLCCHDMLHEKKLGNIIDTGSLKSIVETDKYRKLYKLSRNKQLDICQDCN